MIDFAGFSISVPLMNAAGTCRNGREVRELASSLSAAVVVGSVTLEPRVGNEGKTYWSHPTYSINSLGLPNPGLAFYIDALPHMLRIVHDHGKPLIVSIAGFSVEEYAQLARTFAGIGVDIIEVNMGCPNIWQGKSQKAIGCFDLMYLRNVCMAVTSALDQVTKPTGRRVSFGVKISPFSDPVELSKLGAILTELSEMSDRIKFVTTSNTFPNSMAIDERGRPRLDPLFGGLGGPALKPISLGQVKQLREILPKHFQIIGVGGVCSGKDIEEYLAVGADLVQVCTTYWNSKRRETFAELLIGTRYCPEEISRKQS
jgi:dihydroorotate dehydrogenase (fumarate)